MIVNCGIDEILRADPTELPVARALRLVPAVRQLPFVDPA